MGTLTPARKVAAIAAAASAGAVLAACAIVSPRRADSALDRQWEYLSRFRYAHRGLHDNATPAPENSRAAFSLARAQGYGSELDVHLTADDQLAIIHDSDIERVCGITGTVEEMSLDQLRRCRLFGTQEAIPTLAEVLEIYEPRDGEVDPPPLVVEAKTHGGNYARLVARIMEALDAHHAPYCVESFDPRVLWWLRNRRPEVLRGQLSENFAASPHPEVSFVGGLMHSALLFNVLARPDFVAYRHRDRLHPSVRLACGWLGAHLATWTIRTAEQLAEVEGRGGIGIFEGFRPSPLKP